MGQSNSTLANSPSSSSSSPSLKLPSTPSTMPSMEDLRDVPQRILATTNKALGDLGGSIVSITKPIISSLPGRKEGPSLPSLPPPPPPPLSSQAVLWVRRNPGKVVLGSVLMSAAFVAGSMAYIAAKSHRQQQMKSRIVRGRDSSRREVVVVTNVATLEGTALALDLDERGFIVFVVVPDQTKADEIQGWGRVHIFPIIVPDLTEANDVQVLVAEVSAYLEYLNNAIARSRSTVARTEWSSDTTQSGVSSSQTFASPVFSTSSSFMLVEEEEHLPSSPLPAAMLSASSDHQSDSDKEEVVASDKQAERAESHASSTMHVGDVTGPLYRLSAVIINPQDKVAGSIEKMDTVAWRRCLDVNVTGTIQITHQLLPLLMSTTALSEPRTRSPRVIFITSALTSTNGLPYQSAICASQHAIASIADSLRREIQQKGIDVVYLKTGTIRSPSAVKGGPFFHGQDLHRYLGLYSGLFRQCLDPISMIKAAFQEPSTTTLDLCDAVFDAVIATRPHLVRTVAHGGIAYLACGWIAPRRVVDWSIIRRAAHQPH